MVGEVQEGQDAVRQQPSHPQHTPQPPAMAAASPQLSSASNSAGACRARRLGRAEPGRRSRPFCSTNARSRRSCRCPSVRGRSTTRRTRGWAPAWTPCTMRRPQRPLAPQEAREPPPTLHARGVRVQHHLGEYLQRCLADSLETPARARVAPHNARLGNCRRPALLPRLGRSASWPVLLQQAPLSIEQHRLSCTSVLLHCEPLHSAPAAARPAQVRRPSAAGVCVSPAGLRAWSS